MAPALAPGPAGTTAPNRTLARHQQEHRVGATESYHLHSETGQRMNLTADHRPRRRVLVTMLALRNYCWNALHTNHETD